MATSEDARAVIVTGATSGIGAAAAAYLAEVGWRVVLAGRRADLGEKAAAAIREAGGSASFIQTDVADPESVDRLVQGAVALNGRLDAVVNNAAVFHFGTIETTSEADWRRVLDTNVGGVYRVSARAIPHLRRVGGGTIVNVSSVHAVATMESVAAYAASKGAILALSREMALDFARDRIRVVPLIVGGVETDMAYQHLAGMGKTAEEAGFSHDDRLIGRIGDPLEIARVIGFLLSTDASFVTGAPIAADGGLLARL